MEKTMDMNDANQQRETQIALKRTKEALEEACRFAGFWMWIYDMEHDCIYPSQNLQQDYGMPEVLENFPQSWFDMGFIAPDYVEYHREKVKAIKEGSEKEEFECKVIHRDGSVHWSRIRFNRLKNDPGFAVGTSQLIDDEKSKQEMLSAALFTLVPMVISANLTENTYRMLNYDFFYTKKVQRSGIYDALIAAGAATIPDDQKGIFEETFKREHMVKAYENGEKSVQLEHQQWGDDGVLRWIDTNAIFVPDKDGCIHTITLSQDITGEREKNLELALALKAAKAATQAKSEFLSRMSHEIRTPMNAIMGMTAIAQENRSDFLQVSECLNKIDLSSHYLLTLLNDILEMSRIESGKTVIRGEEFDFAILMEGIRTIVETLAAQNDIRYECINKADLDYLYKGDRMRIQQVMVNIITNAIKFTKPGGRVRFTVECEEKDDDQMMFHFTVADTGIGMSEEFMGEMFKPFTQEDSSNTSKYQGSGLGLAISKNLIRLMGGSISVVSFLGVGSTFRIELPLKRTKKSYLYHLVRQVDAAKAPLKEEDLKDKKILMAEDHPMNVMIAKKLLENKGVIVTVAVNGKQAVELFEQSEPFYYDAILMDIRMPVMDGMEATRQIRRSGRADAKLTPIIAMTANALDEDRRNTKEAGMNAHLAKPFEPKQLYETLMEWIENHPDSGKGE